MASTLPQAAISSLAPFSPIPGQPGMLSELSPISVSTSPTLAGGTPNTSSTPFSSSRRSSRVCHILIEGSRTSCMRSLSVEAITTSNPAAAARAAIVPMTSSASTSGSVSTATPSRPSASWVSGICTRSSSGIGGRWAL